MIPTSGKYLRRLTSETGSGLECRIPNLISLMIALRMKFSSGMRIYVKLDKDPGSHLRCWDCRWELSTMNGKRTASEEIASAFAPCMSCSVTTINRCDPNFASQEPEGNLFRPSGQSA
eukprot:501846-Amphidinium_carterae.1